jgi:hypothetical protein
MFMCVFKCVFMCVCMCVCMFMCVSAGHRRGDENSMAVAACREQHRAASRPHSVRVCVSRGGVPVSTTRCSCSTTQSQRCSAARTLVPLAGRPGTSGSSVMLPPPNAECSLAARRNRMEKNLGHVA